MEFAVGGCLSKDGKKILLFSNDSRGVYAALVSVANDYQIGSLEIAALAESVDDGLERCVEAGVGELARAVYCNAYCDIDRFGPKTLVIGQRETAIGVVDDQRLSHDSDLERLDASCPVTRRASANEFSQHEMESFSF
jgi:hypothetical protein